MVHRDAVSLTKDHCSSLTPVESGCPCSTVALVNDTACGAWMLHKQRWDMQCRGAGVELQIFMNKATS